MSPSGRSLGDKEFFWLYGPFVPRVSVVSARFYDRSSRTKSADAFFKRTVRVCCSVYTTPGRESAASAVEFYSFSAGTVAAR